MNKRIRHLVEGFTPVEKRLAIIRIKSKLFISLICAHPTMEEKYKEFKDERLVQAYDRCPGHDIKIVLGDFNTKVGMESMFVSTVRKIRHHEKHPITV